jgi:menaquinone-dependent protoporphyrinogen oxidase
MEDQTMKVKILVSYASSYGSTQEVAAAVAKALQAGGLEVDLQPANGVRSLDGYEAVVLGAPLIMFRWHKEAKQFLKRHRKALEERPVAVFVLGPTHEPHDEQEWQSSWEQLEKELANFPWFQPAVVEMFGGKYDPEKLRFPLKMMAGDAPATDIRDWEAIHDWAEGLAARWG